ncbi:bifunctional aspartate kinase/homoserine dehydrogenase I [Buchnera aphidicola (Hyadaphis tataricae)]|uniref:Bifunctional aspartokinase/homoserine dehydrogenase n=1 Tax=Buchnera aphidicola (Hyadaphis tataricae) TaxID=1241859 RepID=A0A4D6Y574_9GAMM|nr:bifunctional aspartate kinase/homoserine dehydrogenase I [Buchnera aphidicola]QCI21508.1 bifunctional aspartate kinase/homoserine dehydrogenase I [Buchnera aphidicola (Hyadaphis tataricae)]
MKLLKFGGTSLANAEKFLHVSEIIEKKNRFEQTAVVLSAPAKITNNLVAITENTAKKEIALNIVDATKLAFVELVKNISKIQPNFNYLKIIEIIKEEFNKLKSIIHDIVCVKYCPNSIHAIIVSRGEILSVEIMKSILKAKNYTITVINPVEKIFSIGDYLDSTVNIAESKKRISAMLINNKDIILMAGFIAGNEKKELVVLGRNGSDYSAAVLAVCLNAKCCEIWTDVDGVFTCDPKIVSNALLLESISYQEAMELSYFGAKVLHPRTIEPIAQFKIPCIIKNTNNIKSHGTSIYLNHDSKKNYLKGVTHLDDIVMLNISGYDMKNINNITPRVFNIISKSKVKIILITQSSSENKINLCMLENKKNIFLDYLKKEFQLELKEGLLNPFRIKKNLSILSVIGSDIYKKHNIASKIFSSLGSAKINVLAIAQGSSKHSISIVVEQKNILNAIKNVHEELFFNNKTIHVFLIGIGGVGNALLEQISQQEQFLKKQNINIKVCLIANSKKMLIMKNAIDLSNWKNHFQQSNHIFNLKLFKQTIKKYQFLNAVIIDCTSDQLLSEQYTHFLKNQYHIVTSNKKANTATWEYYQEIRDTARKNNKKFLYETNVGAGLPIIKTVQNLFKTGDHLIRFQGILSGSLSFIFGRLEEGILLSQATKEAKKLGFTEPNPFDDLSGIDVARKLLILAREAGYSIELKDIKIENLLPKPIENKEDINKFLLELEKLDSYFLKRVKTAHDSGCVLRFIGTIEQTGKCFIKIEEVGINHPLYKVKNGENAFAFYTKYYKSIPLVLRGYGAGNNVTASGVFSDLLHTLS